MKSKLWTPCLVAAALLALPLAGCSPEEPAEEPMAEEPIAEPEPAPMAVTAHANVAGAEGSSVSGEVSFSEKDGALHVTAHLSGLEPGEHGFHIHENGVCEGDFTSAGGHFNPAGVDHGCPPDSPRHAGDLGNVTIGANGTGTLEVTVDNATLGAGPASIVGKAVLVHAHVDDCKTQPTGDAGGRLACGVIAMDGMGAMDAMDHGAMEDHGTMEDHGAMDDGGDEGGNG